MKISKIASQFVLLHLWLLGTFPLAAQEPVLESQDSLVDVTTQPDTIPPGIQGSVNPLTDNTFVLTGDDLLDKSFPNSWPIFGTGIRMSVGGYVKGDFIQDFQYIGDRYEFELGSIAVDGAPEREQGGITTFHAKQTRVNFDFRSTARWGNGREFPMQIFVEIDWFFDAPTFRLNTRLRHAYGVIGRLLVGQSWTTSADLSALPGTIDFSGGDALYGGRVTQIRWHDRINDKFQYAVALEEPGGQIENPLGLEGSIRPRWPNIAGMIKWKSNLGSSIQLGADVFPINWSGPSDGPNATEVGYALTVMGRMIFKTTQYHDSFVWGAGYGHGQAHKIITLAWDGKASGVVTPDGLTLSPAWFAFAGYNHYWSKNLNSTIATNWTGTDLADAQSDETIAGGGSFHANLIWFPYSLISTGIEYMWGLRENKDGVQGTANRIQFMVKFKFH